MRNPFYGLVAKRHYVVVEEANVLELLGALTQIHYADQNLMIGKCDVKGAVQWFVHFDASPKHWENIVAMLKPKFDLIINDGSKNIYLKQKE